MVVKPLQYQDYGEEAS